MALAHGGWYILIFFTLTTLIPRVMVEWNELDSFRYGSVTMDDLRNVVWLELAESRSAAMAVKHILTWCKTLRPPGVWVRDAASHFKNRKMKTFEKALKLDRRCAVATSPWSDGTCERMIH